LDLRDLQQLTVIAEEGSYAQAARRLHISPPALSRSIKEIEGKIGVRLFDRGRQGAVPTDAGWTLIQHAAPLAAAAKDLQREVAIIRGQGSGILRVGAGIYPSALFLGKGLGGVLQRGNNIQIRITGGGANDLLGLMRKRELDLVVADPAWREGAEDIAAVPLSRHQGYLFVRNGHPLLHGKRPTLEDAATYPLVASSLVPMRLAHLTPKKDPGATRMQKIFGQWPLAVKTDSVRLMIDALQHSDAVTLLSLGLAQKKLEAGTLKVLPINLSWIQVSFAVMHLSQRNLSPLAEILIEETRSVCKQLEAEEAALKTKWVPNG
jgi:DNA-binding transcriptional LysR family regulator